MNRRDAIQALIALPGVARIATAPVRPSDVIVVEADEHLSCDTMQRIKTTVEAVFPGQKVMVMDRGLRLKIVEGQST